MVLLPRAFCVLALLTGFAAASPPPGHLLVLTGRVVDGLGRPVAGAQVRLQLVRSLWEGGRESPLAEAWASADGTYRIVDPEAATGDFCACCLDAFLEVRRGEDLGMSGAIPRWPGELRLRDLVVTPPFALRGRVRDAEGRPVSLESLALELGGMGRGEEPGLAFGSTVESCSPVTRPSVDSAHPPGSSWSRGRPVRMKLAAGAHRVRLIYLGGGEREFDVMSVPTDPERVIRVP
ncbi:MAG: carboxypeptidase-like regulatory domain-containing protein [Planctomycetota bacterium]